MEKYGLYNSSFSIPNKMNAYSPKVLINKRIDIDLKGGFQTMLCSSDLSSVLLNS